MHHKKYLARDRFNRRIVRNKDGDCFFQSHDNQWYWHTNFKWIGVKKKKASDLRKPLKFLQGFYLPIKCRLNSKPKVGSCWLLCEKSHYFFRCDGAPIGALAAGTILLIMSSRFVEGKTRENSRYCEEFITCLFGDGNVVECTLQNFLLDCRPLAYINKA